MLPAASCTFWPRRKSAWSRSSPRILYFASARRGIMRWLVLAFVTVAAPALAQPSIAGVDPHSVRAGGTIVVQIDTNDYQGPIIVSVFRQHPPLLAKHVSKLLEDNKPGDDAPQVGIIKYRIKTDDSWLSTIDLKTNLATSEEQYKISIISGSLQSINAPTAKASLQPLEFARVITVLGHEGPLDQDAVLEGD